MIIYADITRSQTLPEPTDITQELWQTADELLCHRLPESSDCCGVDDASINHDRHPTV